MSPHPLGGFSATELTLPSSERAQADALLEARQLTQDSLGAAATFGVLTMLLREGLEAHRGAVRGAVRAFFAQLDLPSLGAQLNEGDLRSIQRGSTQVGFVVGSNPFASEQLDFRHARGCELGQSLLTFTG